MSFNIFVSGIAGTKISPTHFTYSADNLPDDDTFKTPELLSKLSTIKDAGDAVKEAAPSGSLVDALLGLGLMSMLGKLKINTTALMLKAGNHGKIMVSCEEINLLWVNTVRVSTFTVLPGSGPAKSLVDFISRVAPALIETNLNCFGVLDELANVFDKYNKQIGSDQPGVNLIIHLTKN